jgi:hypothetical protein
MEIDAIKENLYEIWKDLEKTQWIQSIGQSMRPLIVDGSSLALQFCKPDKIKLGHIIAFRRNKDTVVHRVIGFWNQGTQSYFIERGDNNPHCLLIEQESLLGRVIAIKYKNRTLSLKSPLWRLLDFFFVIYGWFFTGLFWVLYKLKVILFGREKTAWSQWTYRFLMESLLFIPRNLARLLKRVKR